MANLIKTKIGRLRILGFLEGISFIVLVFIGMPMKRMMNDPFIVKTVGPIHGILFVLFVLNVLMLSTQYKWSFKTTTWKLLAASVLPFGTFYVDKKILKNV